MNTITRILTNFILNKISRHLSFACYWTDNKNVLLGCNLLYQNILEEMNKCDLLNQPLYILQKKYQLKTITKYTNRDQNEFIKNKKDSYFKEKCSMFLGVNFFIMDDVTQLIDKNVRLESEVTKLQNQMEKTNAYLDNVIRIVPASIYWKDTNFVIQGSNLFHTQLAGFSDPSEVIGKSEYDFIWKDQAVEIIENDKRIIEQGKGCRLEEKAKLADGCFHTFLTSKEPLKDKNDQIIGIIGISIDITEQKESEKRTHEAEAIALLAQSKADFEEETRKILMILVGDIVHDLRTPIATIRSSGSLLSTIMPSLISIIDEAQELGSQKIQQINKRKLKALQDNTLIQSILNAVSMMDAFINSTLKELGNAQKGLQEDLSWEDLTVCSSRRILENTIDAFPIDSSIIIHRNTSYDFNLKGNNILIMKILFNLLRNAVDQIHLHAKGEIYISTQAQNDVNQIIVKDTAGGVQPEILSKIFDGYFTTKKNGTGIGLASCKKIIESFGGTLNTTNVYNEYIEFILSFPKIN